MRSAWTDCPTGPTLGAMTTRAKRRTATATLAAIAVAVAVILTILVPAIAEHTTSSWGDLYAAGFGLGLLVAWALGTLTFTSSQRRERT